jgi:6-pyruvoyltetrahydropterin/6-carboxytetrahydropterin synthase
MATAEIDGRGTMSAAITHFVPGHPKCGTLHGHDVSLSVQVEAEKLDEMGFVVDFSLVKRAMREVLESLDHKGLVCPAHLEEYIEIEGVNYARVYNGSKQYFIPRSDVVFVKVQVATAEEMSRWALLKIWFTLPLEIRRRIDMMNVTFWETTHTGATARIVNNPMKPEQEVPAHVVSG